MTDWVKRKLGNISNSCLGKMLDHEKNKGEYHPYLANLNVRWGGFELHSLQKMRFQESEQERYGLEFGDLVICEGGEPGRCAIWRDEVPNMKIQKALHRLRVSSGYDLEFIYYRMLLAGKNGELQNHFIGSTIKHLTGIALKQIEFSFPPIVLQTKIGSTLAILDAKIFLNKKINAKLEAMAKLIYDYWFIQFDFPDENGKPYKSSGGEMFWCDRLKQEIPEGWEVKPVSYLIQNQKTGEWGKEEISSSTPKNVHCVRGADITNLNERGDAKFPSRFISEKQLEKKLDAYDLIVEISGGSPTQSTGRIAITPRHLLDRFEKPFVCSNFCKALTLKDVRYGYFFEGYWKRVYSSGNFFNWEGKTSGIKNLIFDQFVETNYVAIPPSKLIQEHFSISDKWRERRELGLRENQELVNLRDWLLPMLMNGQVTVSE